MRKLKTFFTYVDYADDARLCAYVEGADDSEAARAALALWARDMDWTSIYCEPCE